MGKNRQVKRTYIKFLGVDIYRLFLNLLLLSTFGFLIWFGIKLFGEHAFDATVGSIVFIVSFVFFIWLWRHVKRNSWRNPSIKLTIVCLIALFIVTAFAGVQPMVSYKDGVANKVTTTWDNWQSEQEQKRIAEEDRRAAEKAEMQATGVSSNYDFYKNYVVLFNKFRSESGKSSLVFDTRLNELAARRAVEISQPGNFSHEGIKQYNFGENIAMMAYSSDSAETLLGQWAGSSGHRSNMLSSMYRRTGFAKNGKYAVQIFD